MSPKGNHHEVVKAALLQRWFRLAPDDIRLTPETTFRLSEDTYLEPDVVIYARATGLKGMTATNVLLVVEIADSSLLYDIGRKAALYAAFGVRELWVVDAVKLMARIFRDPAADGYHDTRDFAATDPPHPTIRAGGLRAPARRTVKRSCAIAGPPHCPRSSSQPRASRPDGRACGHGGLFPAKPANDWVGRAIGIVTMTPYDHWRRLHAIHHATSGNLDRRGIGDIKTMTVREYFARNWRGRLRYRLYRHPLVMFELGPLYLFLIENRLPFGFMRKGAMPWLSTMTTNIGILVAAGLLIWSAGIAPFLIVCLPIIAIAGAVAVWFFCVQHQFEGTTWEAKADWSQPEAALHGSSFYDLPPPLPWFSGNIGVHHVHHLSSGIPFYRLSEVLRNHPELRKVGRLTLRDSFACVRLALWDEEKRQMVSFGEERASRRIGPFRIGARAPVTRPS